MGQRLNTYFDFAEDDFRYFQFSYDSGIVANAMGAMAQGICEKYLKHLVENYVQPVGYEKDNERENILRTHSLTKLIRYLNANLPDFQVDRTKLKMIEGFYFTTRYPGEDSIDVTKEDIEDCKNAIEECREQVCNYIRANEIQIEPTKDKLLKSSLPSINRKAKTR